jgi:hypothetical protein
LFLSRVLNERVAAGRLVEVEAIIDVANGRVPVEHVAVGVIV